MRVFDIHKDASDCQYLLVWDEKYEAYRWVDLTSHHICSCLFKTIEDAIYDLEVNRPEVISYKIKEI